MRRAGFCSAIKSAIIKVGQSILEDIDAFGTILDGRTHRLGALAAVFVAGGLVVVLAVTLSRSLVVCGSGVPRHTLRDFLLHLAIGVYGISAVVLISALHLLSPAATAILSSLVAYSLGAATHAGRVSGPTPAISDAPGQAGAQQAAATDEKVTCTMWSSTTNDDRRRESAVTPVNTPSCNFALINTSVNEANKIRQRVRRDSTPLSALPLPPSSAVRHAPDSAHTLQGY